jgi:hypothetical protein
VTIAEITPSTFAEEPPPGPAATIAATRTLAGGTYLRITGVYDLSLGTPTLSIADNNGKAGTFAGPFDAANDATASQGGVQFITTTPTTAGSCTITITSSISVFALCINVQEFSGSSGPQPGAHTSNLQASPGTGTDAVTSGTLTPTGAVLAAGLTMDLGGAGAASPSAGTGFTDAGTGWDLGVGHNLARAESKRITAPAGVTFTTGTNDRFGTWAALFLETPLPSGYLQPPVIPAALRRAALYDQNWDPLPGLPVAAAVVGVFSQPEERKARAARAVDVWDPLPALPSLGWGFSQGTTSPVPVHVPEGWDPLPGLALAPSVSGYECESPRGARLTRIVPEGWDPLPGLGASGVQCESPRSARIARVVPEGWDPLPGLGASGVQCDSPRGARLSRIVPEGWDPLPALASVPAGVSGYECESPRGARPTRAVPEGWDPLPALASVPAGVSGYECESPRGARPARAVPEGWDPLPALAAAPPTGGYESESPRAARRSRVVSDNWEPLARLLGPSVDCAAPATPRRRSVAVDNWDPVRGLASLGGLFDSQPLPRRLRQHVPDGWDPLAAPLAPPPVTANNGAMILAW